MSHVNPRCITATALLGLTLIGAPLQGQGSVNTVVVGRGPGWVSASRMCPANMLITGIRDWANFDCSLFKADGSRFGPVSPQSAGSSNTFPFADVGRTVSCPGNGAVSSFRGSVASDGEVDHADVYCAGVGPNGGQTSSQRAGSLSGGTSILVAFGPFSDVTARCPGTKFANGLVVANGGVALSCIDAPLMTNSVSHVALSTFATTGGTDILGTVLLNGYAVGSITVALAATDVSGVTVPPSVTIKDGAHDATFVVHTGPQSAGCGTVKATFGSATVSAPLTVSPMESTGGLFSFALEPASASLTWRAPSSITAVITFSSGAPKVEITSDHPDVLSIQPSIQQIGTRNSVRVTMNALKSGCATVTATVNGQLTRKTLRLVTGM